jgi:hypothetical protein
MPSDGETCDDSQRVPEPPPNPEPGVVVIFSR